MTTTNEDVSLYMLSFVDPVIAATIPPGEDRPGGPSWLGTCVVAATDHAGAVSRAWVAGCNPGGEVQILGPFPAEWIGPEYRDRLMTDLAEVENIPKPATLRGNR